VITLLAIAKAQQRHLQEIGMLIAAIGGVAFVVAAVLGIMDFERRIELTVVAIAGVLLAAGAIVALVGLHGGL